MAHIVASKFESHPEGHMRTLEHILPAASSTRQKMLDPREGCAKAKGFGLERQDEEEGIFIVKGKVASNVTQRADNVTILNRHDLPTCVLIHLM